MLPPLKFPQSASQSQVSGCLLPHSLLLLHHHRAASKLHYFHRRGALFIEAVDKVLRLATSRFSVVSFCSLRYPFHSFLGHSLGSLLKKATMACQRRGVALVILVTLGLVSIIRVDAKEYNVGADILGWIIPTPKTYYDDWLADKKFVSGDVLVFNYLPGAHNVLQVTKPNFEECVLENPIVEYSTGEDKVTLDEPGDYYFVCGVSIHCVTLNQKIRVTVSAGSATPAPKPSPIGNDTTPVSAPGPEDSPPARPAPPPSSASGLQASLAFACSLVMVFVASTML